jgi:DNA polymerase I-like protein with 3'-5' exonuclease and polymerase domains
MSFKPLVIDVEGDSEGHVFNYDHKMYMLGLHNGKETWQFPIEWIPGEPYGHHIKEAQEIINAHTLLIGANFKHDLLWCRRYRLNTQSHAVWCLQYAEFCLSGQTWRLPDLDTACKNRGIEGKIPWDWSKPFNTYPWEDAARYNGRDLAIELALFWAQVEVLKEKPQLKKLIWHGSQDLQITAEMEWNGLKYDHELSISKGTALLNDVSRLEAELRGLLDSSWAGKVNWGSPAHLSALLYGGDITWEERVPYEFVYKNPKKPPVTKFKTVEKSITLPRLVEPLKGSENSNGFSTEEGVLKRLKPTGLAVDIISRLLEIRGLNKLVGTYYHGIPKLAKEMNWENNIIHGQLHHCVTQTGRLSSSKPNQQNIDYGVRQCLITRFPLTTHN